MSPACDHCYAVRGSDRLAAMGQKNYADLTRSENGLRVFNGKVRAIDREVDRPRRWSTPQRIFAVSMGDCFHADLPVAFLQRIFATIREVDRHQYLLLTKRPDRAARLWPVLTGGDTFSQIRFGITAENQHWLDKRLAPFMAVPTPTKFISVEPMLGPVVLPEVLLDMGPRLQIVIGGESGPDARPMAESWVTKLVRQCLNADIAIFFKQWGEWAPERTGPLPTRTCKPAGTDETMFRFGKKAAGRLLWGMTWDGEPSVRHQNDKEIPAETNTTALPEGWKPGDLPPWRSSGENPPRRGFIKC